MGTTDKEQYDMVFKRSENADSSQVTKDIQLSNVLWAVDGARSIGAIAAEDHYDLEELHEKMMHLVRLGIIELTANKVQIVSWEFMQYLSERLSKEVGPMADILIEDTTESLGYHSTQLPTYKLQELVNLLSMEIEDVENASIFRKDMMALMRSPKLVV